MKRKWIGYWMVLLLSVLALSLYGCGDDGGGGGGGGGGAEEEGELGNATMTLAGGEGTTTGGGMGGTALLGAFGNIKISQSGDVDTSFSIPEYTPIDLGDNPLYVRADNPFVVDSNLTIPVYPNSMTEYHTGYYLMVGDCNIYLGDGVNPPTVVTGLQVDKGFTLTLGLNKDTNYNSPPNPNSGEDQARICFCNDVHILGTITTQDLTTGNVQPVPGDYTPVPDVRHYESEASSNDKGSLEIEAYRIVMEDSGKIDTSGLDGVAPLAGNTVRGGDGGGVELENNQSVTDVAGGGIFLKGGSIDATGGNGAGLADGGDGAVVSGGWDEITLEAYGVIINKAALDASAGTSGPDWGVGGNAGDVEMWASSSIYNTGPLNANGGNSSGVPVKATAVAIIIDGVEWGNAGDIELMSEYASVFNSAALNANGGSGPQGGCGGLILLLAAGTADGWRSAGQVKNSGALTADGGDSSGEGVTAITGWDGGDGGAMVLETYGGTIKNSGALTANGGTGWGEFPDEAQPEDVPRGGSGGCVQLFDDLGLFPPWDNYNTAKAPGPIEVTGNISLNGGTGPCGGDGGELIALNGLCPLNLLDPRSVGTIAFKGYGGGPINLNGGKGVVNTPDWDQEDGYWQGFGGELVAACGLSVYGMLDFKVAAPDNGSSSGLSLGFGSVTNNVPIQAMGGEGTQVGGFGGYVAMGVTPEWEKFPPEVIETLAVKNSASIDVSGGAGGYEGGWGGGIAMFGHDLTDNSGALTANGGDSTSTTPVSASPDGGNPGDGAMDEITLGSSYDVNNSGKITANGGNVLGESGLGGDGAEWVDLWAGNHVTNSGSIFANGGNGGSVEGWGGDGGLIDLFSDIVATSNTADTLQVKEGVPDGPGENGHILLDGTDVTPPGGTLP